MDHKLLQVTQIRSTFLDLKITLYKQASVDKFQQRWNLAQTLQKGLKSHETQCNEKHAKRRTENVSHRSQNPFSTPVTRPSNYVRANRVQLLCIFFVGEFRFTSIVLNLILMTHPGWSLQCGGMFLHLVWFGFQTDLTSHVQR